MSGLYLPLSTPTTANTYTVDDQTRPVTVALSNGGYITTWVSREQDGSGRGFYGQKFDAFGNPVGGEFRLNSHTAGDQQNLTMTELANGHFVAVWESYGQDGSRWGVFAQRMDRNGNLIGPEFQVADETENNQSRPTVTALNDGFAIGWYDSNNEYTFGQYGDLLDQYDKDAFYIQLYTNTGQEVGDELRMGGMSIAPSLNLNTYSTTETGVAFGQMLPTADGGFAVIYQASQEVLVNEGAPDAYSYAQYGVTFFQTFDETGIAIDDPVSISNDLSNQPVQMLAMSNDQVAVLGIYTDGGPQLLGLRFLDPVTGTLSATAFSFDLYANNHGITGTETISHSSYSPRYDLAEMADGSLLLVYATYQYVPEYDLDGHIVDNESTYRIMGVQLDTDGTPLNPEFLIAQIIEEPPVNLDITALSGGGAVVNWEQFGVDGAENRDVQQVTLLGLSSGTTGDDTLTGTGTTDWIDALSGDDRVSGLGGDDLLEGNLGNDYLNGGGGNDRLDGGAGTDVLFGGSGNDLHYGGDGNDRLVTNAGDDLFDGGDGIDTLFLRTAQELDLRQNGVDHGDGADRFVSIENVLGSNGADRITGDDGANVLNGRSGNDLLSGAGGNDTILGGNGNDTLVGGVGADNLTGGNNADRFVFAAAAHLGLAGGADRITDFQTGLDVIALNALNLTWIDTGAFTGTGAELRVNLVGAHSQLQLDLDGDGLRDADILVLNQTGLSAADFLL